jgi:hypothetical protein
MNAARPARGKSFLRQSRRSGLAFFLAASQTAAQLSFEAI